jgi:hypothetical protein
MDQGYFPIHMTTNEEFSFAFLIMSFFQTILKMFENTDYLFYHPCIRSKPYGIAY